jgi:hypothetical protein
MNESAFCSHREPPTARSRSPEAASPLESGKGFGDGEFTPDGVDRRIIIVAVVVVVRQAGIPVGVREAGEGQARQPIHDFAQLRMGEHVVEAALGFIRVGGDDGKQAQGGHAGDVVARIERPADP